MSRTELSSRRGVNLAPEYASHRAKLSVLDVQSSSVGPISALAAAIAFSKTDV